MKYIVYIIIFILFTVPLNCASAKKNKKKNKHHTTTATVNQTEVSSNSNLITPTQYAQLLGKGLDVDWSKTDQGVQYYSKQTVTDFKKIGINHVRIRIKDNANEQLLKHLDIILNDCIQQSLIPVIAYQGDDFKNNPSDANLQKVVEWWKIVSTRYKDYSPFLSFDLLIEVTDALNKNQSQLNKLYESAVTEIRKTNPTRILFISPIVRSDPEYLKDLSIPTNHNNFIMAEWHFYASGPSKTNSKKLWTTGTSTEKELILQKIKFAKDWEKKTGIKTWVGAWMPGNYNDGNDYSIQEQVVFSQFVSCALTKENIPFAVNSDTKFYNRETNKWIDEMLPVLYVILHTANKCNQ